MRFKSAAQSSSHKGRRKGPSGEWGDVKWRATKSLRSRPPPPGRGTRPATSFSSSASCFRRARLLEGEAARVDHRFETMPLDRLYHRLEHVAVADRYPLQP